MLPLSMGQKVSLGAIVLHLVKCHPFHNSMQYQKLQVLSGEMNWQCFEVPSWEKFSICFSGTEWIRWVFLLNCRHVAKSLQYGQCLWSILLRCETHTHTGLHPAPLHTSVIVYSEYNVASTFSPCGLDQSVAIMLIWAVSHWEKKKKDGG